MIHAGTVMCFPFALASARHISPWQILPSANFFILLLRAIQTFPKIEGVKMQCFPPVKIWLAFSRVALILMLLGIMKYVGTWSICQPRTSRLCCVKPWRVGK